MAENKMLRDENITLKQELCKKGTLIQTILCKNLMKELRLKIKQRNKLERFRLIKMTKDIFKNHYKSYQISL